MEGKRLIPERAARAIVRDPALTSRAANLPLAPFGPMPMRHGEGGVTAQQRFGGWTGCRPAIGMAAGATALIDPAVGLAAGWPGEPERTAVARAFRHPSETA